MVKKRCSKKRIFHCNLFLYCDFAIHFQILKDLRISFFQAEVQLNFQKRRGLGVLSMLRPKFSGVLGEALDVAVRWSGDVVSSIADILVFNRL